MADNYQQFSAILEIEGKQLEWALQFAEIINQRAEDYESGDSSEDPTDALPEMLQYIKDGSSGVADDRYSIESGRMVFEKDEGGIWFHDDGGSNLDMILNFVETVLKHFALDTVFSVTWANTCSKPRVDEFGGGWAVVSRLGIESGCTGTYVMSATDKITKQLEELRKKT